MQHKCFITLFLLFATSIAFGSDRYGWRQQLENRGFTISSYYATDIGGNPVGGLRKGLIYSGFLDIGVALDLEKIASLRNLTLKITNYVASGQNLSADIGNFFGVQEVYASGNYFFGILALSLTLLNDQLTVEVGRLLAGDIFVRSELWQYYLTSGVNGNLESLEANIFFPRYNIAAWGARFLFEPNRQWQILGGVYNANPKIREPDEHGLDFSLRLDKGFLALGQINYQHHQTRKERGLPGSVGFGSYYESNKFNALDFATNSTNGKYGFYLLFDQMILRGKWPEYKGPSHLRSGAAYSEKAKKPYHQQQIEAKDRPLGLTAWGAVYFAPHENINIQRYQLAGGVLYQGLFLSRDLDVTAFGVIRGKFSDKLVQQEAETVLELNHRFQFGSLFYITPDIQYVIKPNGRTDIPNALVLGIEATVNF